MSGKIGLRDIAEAAGVSLATVSRVFNQHPNVRERVRQRVLQVAQQLDYSAHKGTRRDHVTILVEGLADIGRSSYQAEMLGALVSQLAASGFRPDVRPVETADLDLMGGQYTLATLVIVWEKAARKRIAETAQPPVILVNEYEPGWHAVVTDHRQGLVDAVNYLTAAGHRRIGLVRFWEGSWADRERFTGYCEGLAAAGIPYVPELQVAYNHVPRAEALPILLESMRELLSASPTAVVVCSEDLALPAARAVRQLGLRIPEDLSFITFENPAVSAFYDPPLTTVNQEPLNIAKEVTRLVEALAQNPEQERSQPHLVQLPNVIEKRASVANRLHQSI